MNRKYIALPLRIALALFLSIQVWVWLRYAGAFWISDSMGIMKDLIKSINPLKGSLDGFAFFVAPALFITLLVHKRLPVLKKLALYVLSGVFCSTLYLFYMAMLYLPFIERQIWIYIAAGGIAGLTYCGIIEFQWYSHPTDGDKNAVSQVRRRLLGSIGVSAGASGLLGSLPGPIHFLVNQDTHIDMNVSRLEDGQLMTVAVDNKPVWILKRSSDLIRLLEQDNPRLLDPLSEFSQQPKLARNKLRSIRPEYFVVYGICTHLGCVPSYLPHGRENEEPNQDSAPQFLCPCHGGVFDLAGRVYKDTPPPVNMVIPNYEYVSKDVIRLYPPSLVEEWTAQYNF